MDESPTKVSKLIVQKQRTHINEYVQMLLLDAIATKYAFDSEN